MSDKAFAASRESVTVAFRDGLSRPDMRRRLEFQGLTLEHIRLPSQVEYEFERAGTGSCLVLFDLVLDGGKIKLDGVDSASGGDLRNTVSYIPAGSAMSGWSRPVMRQNSMTVLSFDLDALPDEAVQLLGASPVAPMIGIGDLELTATMRKLETVVVEGLDYPFIYIRALLTVAVLELVRLQVASRVSKARTGELSLGQATRIRDYIEENLANEISLEGLSQLVQLSRFHFARQFKATFGLPPHRYITNRRVEVAKSLLRESSLSVKEICLICGFSSAGLFVKAFRSSTGTTPSAFRRNI